MDEILGSLLVQPPIPRFASLAGWQSTSMVCGPYARDVLPSSPGRATAVGSWPGADVASAVRTAFHELPDPHVPYLPELPDRGPGADLIGRGATLLIGMPIDLQPSGWRLVDRPGRDLARARAWLRQDLDVLAEVADGYAGPLKLQVTGPWTLAASLHLPRLERAVVDPGAVRDVVGSLADGVAQHVQEVRKLVPGAQIVVQVDEPSLPAVLAGSLPTASGLGRLRAIPGQEVADGIRAVLDGATSAGALGTVVHCCAPQPPVAVLVLSGAGAVSVDVTQLGRAGWEAVAVAVEAGHLLWAGIVPTDAPGDPRAAADRLTGAWGKLGLPAARLGDVVLSPACGLAGRSEPHARSVLRTVREAAAEVAERSVA